jgi:hypothetical protein
VTESHVLGVTEYRADGKGHVGRFQSGRRYLIEERHERMKIVLVDDRDSDVSIGQSLGDRDASESPTNDDDVRTGRERPRHGSGGVLHVLTSIMTR